MTTFGERNLTRRELMRRVGSLPQAGGAELVQLEDGHSRGMRAIELRTGSGLRFRVMPDRGLDVGFAEYRGLGLCWLPAKGLPAPWYYEGDLDGHAWLRVGLGGLFNTAGLVSIGVPQEVDTSAFGFTQRLTARYGTHDRIAVTPASRFDYGERWDEDRCFVYAEGLVRQEIAYGENLSLSRRYETELGSSSFTIVDTVRNDGWFTTPHQLLYHFNLGFPLVDDGSYLVAAVEEEPASLGYGGDDGDEGEDWRSITAPQPGFTFGGYVLSLKAGADGRVAVALVNPRLRGGIGVYLRYDARALPAYLAWRMMREGLYAIGLEPATNPFGNPHELREQGYRLDLEPGEQRVYTLEFGILDGRNAIDRFSAEIEALA
jgi:Domain of unknown function (DUF4432)